MPTQWKRSPEEIHKVYIANTEAFYKIAGRNIAPAMDKFCNDCALQLFARSAALGQEHADAINALYSRGMKRPDWLLWALSTAVGGAGEFLPPLFFWNLMDDDVRRGTDYSRVFIRMITNILLYLSAVDDDITNAEADYITGVVDKLSALCDGAGVKAGKPGLRVQDYVTSAEDTYIGKNKDQPPITVSLSGGQPQSGAAPGTAGTEAKTQDEAPAEKPDLDKLMAELDSLIGLETVKKEVKSTMNLIKVRQLRKENELPVPPMSMHMVFMGNPGTGKTTVARLVGGLYAAIGALEKGQLIEVDRSGLVAGYVGQTAMKTQEVITSALGGVLFIDEAYSLSSGGENDFGREAIETLLKAMEDHRENLVVICAGYSGPMEKFLSSNPGLESRFNKYINFEDYNGEQLLQIFQGLCKKNGYEMDDEAAAYAKEYFRSMYDSRDENFGNGRDVRNQFETMMVRQANRLAAMENPGKDELTRFIKADFLPEGADSAAAPAEEG